MQEEQRSFGLPAMLLEEFDGEIERNGLCLTRVIQATVLHFLLMSPADQAACLKRLDDHVPPETYQRATRRRTANPGKPYQRAARRRIVVTDKVMRLHLPPPEQQRTIG